MRTIGDIINMYPKQYKVTLGYPIEVMVTAHTRAEAEDEARPYALEVLEDIFKQHDQSNGEFELIEVELITEDELL
jgi:hypothetical protein